MYYPLSKITPNLYTSGNQFQYTQTGQLYKGYYYSTYDGRFFTEKSPSPISAELTRITAVSTPTPLAAAKYVGNTPISSVAAHYTPTPTAADYTAGYIIRYFIKRVNGDESSIRELSLSDYVTIQKDPLYISTLLNWSISGPLVDEAVPGVISLNRASTAMAEKTLPGLSSYLTDPIQLYK